MHICCLKTSVLVFWRQICRKDRNPPWNALKILNLVPSLLTPWLCHCCHAGHCKARMWEWRGTKSGHGSKPQIHGEKWKIKTILRTRAEGWRMMKNGYSYHPMRSREEHQFRPVGYIRLTRNYIYISSRFLTWTCFPARHTSCGAFLGETKLGQMAVLLGFWETFPGSPSIWTPLVLRQLREQKLLDLKSTLTRENAEVMTGKFM